MILNLWSLQNLKLIHRAGLWPLNAFIWMPDFIKTSTSVCRGRWQLAVIVSQQQGEQMDSVSHLSTAIASFPCATRWVVMTTKSSYSELSIVCSAQTTDWSTSPHTHTLFYPSSFMWESQLLSCCCFDSGHVTCAAVRRSGFNGGRGSVCEGDDMYL